MMTWWIFALFQSVAYNLYEIPLFIAMGAIGQNYLFFFSALFYFSQGAPDFSDNIMFIDFHE